MATDEMKQEAIFYTMSGADPAEVAVRFGVSRATVMRWIARPCREASGLALLSTDALADVGIRTRDYQRYIGRTNMRKLLRPELPEELREAIEDFLARTAFPGRYSRPALSDGMREIINASRERLTPAP